MIFARSFLATPFYVVAVVFCVVAVLIEGKRK